MMTKGEIEDYISERATSLLQLDRGVAFTGKDPLHWQARNLYSFFGLEKKGPFSAMIKILEDKATAGDLMASSRTLERVSATLPPFGVEVEFPRWKETKNPTQTCTGEDLETD